MKQLFTHFLTGLICCTFLIGISAPLQAQININPALTHTSCNLCNGSATFSISGGDAPYNITWEQGEWVNQPLCAGTYTITVTDSSAQTATSTFVINSSEEQAISLIIPQPVHSYYDCNDFCYFPYSLISAPTGFTSYMWAGEGISFGNIDPEIVVSSPGTYCVTVTNSYGCTGSSCTTIFEISTCSYPSYCGNECMGVAEVQLSGGVLPYTYEWGNGVTGTDIQTDLCSGMYYLTITDANNTKAELYFYVSDAMYIQYLLPPYYYYCPDGPINFSVNLPYVSCQWNDGVTGCSRYLTNLGNYSVTVTDTLDCRYSGSTLVNAISPVSISGSSNLTASNPCTTLDADYGYYPSTSYQWSNGQITESIQVCSPGVYCVTATSSAFNCSNSKCLTVTLNGVISSLPDVSASNETVRIWQNPENKTLHIIPQLTNHTSDLATLTFYDVAGRVLLTTNISLNTPAYIDIAHWQSGIYYWQLIPSAANQQSIPISGKVWVRQ